MNPAKITMRMMKLESWDVKTAIQPPKINPYRMSALIAMKTMNMKVRKRQWFFQKDQIRSIQPRQALASVQDAMSIMSRGLVLLKRTALNAM
jgi:hypothetical protein